MKYLITGLGNIGEEYLNTRHNIGFKILDALAEASNISFNDKRYGFVAEFKYKSRILILLKPSTFVNLSGRAVNYWLQKEKISFENLLVISDDLALPFGKLRLKSKGSSGGHNGLESINMTIGRQDYARLRFGIGNEYFPGQQINYVLGEWTEDEEKMLPERVDVCKEIILNFSTLGIERTMNLFNNR